MTLESHWNENKKNIETYERHSSKSFANIIQFKAPLFSPMNLSSNIGLSATNSYSDSNSSGMLNNIENDLKQENYIIKN